VSKETQGAEGAVEKAAVAPAKSAKAPKQEKGAQGAPGGSEGAKKAAEGGSKGPRAEKQGKAQKGAGASEEKAKERGSHGAPVVKDPPGYKPRLKVMYAESVAKDLKEEFSYKSVMQIPKLSKIIVSTGLGEAITNKKLLDSASQEISQITGRKAVRTKAKKSIANFKVRKGMDLGVMVTLRGNVMYEFLDRLINVAMPRIKDFRGANPNAFDGHGNYSLGVTEQIIFPEIDYDKIERVSGMNIAVVTSAKTDQEARSLLARLGMPFRK